MSSPPQKLAALSGIVSKPPSKSAAKKIQAAGNKASGARHTQAFCTKCRAKHDIKGPKLEKTKNNRNMLTGSCAICNNKVNVFVAKDYQA